METLEKDAKNSEPAVHSTVGSLRPKRRWKLHSSIQLQDAEVTELLAPVTSPPPRHRMKRSGQPHRIYPEVVTQIRSTPSNVPAITMAHQIVNFVRSFSFR
jgi:hypothetical protein